MAGRESRASRDNDSEAGAAGPELGPAPAPGASPGPAPASEGTGPADRIPVPALSAEGVAAEAVQPAPAAEPEPTGGPATTSGPKRRKRDRKAERARRLQREAAAGRGGPGMAPEIGLDAPPEPEPAGPGPMDPAMIAELAKGLTLSFEMGFRLASLFAGPKWALQEAEAKALGDAWAPALAPYLGRFAAWLPIGQALVVTAGVLAPRVLAPADPPAEPAPSPAPGDRSLRLVGEDGRELGGSLL